jgi:hypothetical protein
MRVALVTVSILSIVACNDVLGLDEKALATDGGASSTSAANCTFDAEGFGDPGADGCWETVALETVLGGVPFDATNGAAFDGRYLYLAPQESTHVARFDTHGAVADGASWTTFDAKTALGAKLEISGTVFDGRYVTFVPRTDKPLLVRYDTSAPFEDATSWETFDPLTLDPDATAFAGGTYDGRYLYLSPRFHDLALRHDTNAPLAEGWEIFDIEPLVGIAGLGYYSAVYDGRGVVFVPELDGLAVRFDTASPFVASSSWSTFDTKKVTPETLGFTGGAFDGQSIYFAPDDAIVARIDANASFTSASAWSFFDLSEVASGIGLLRAAGFDGRFLFFSPNADSNGATHRKRVRYDTMRPFDDPSSWRVTEAPANVGPSSTCVYDGRSLYFPPLKGSSVFARFAARREAHAIDLPASFH